MKIEIKLKELRKQKNITLSELAKMTGISKSHLNYIENGIKEPTISVLVLIAKALNVKIDELYVIHW